MRNSLNTRLTGALQLVRVLAEVRTGTILRKLCLLAFVVCGMLISVRQAEAALIPTIIYQQNFDSGLPVSEMTAFGSGTVSASAGAALLNSTSSLAYLTNDTFTTENFTMDVDFNQTNGANGGTTSGITVGNRYFFVFPGFTGGAFNLHAFDPNTGNIGVRLSNQDINMGFTPAQNVFHHLKLDVDPINKNLTFRFYQNGNLLSTPFTYSVVADAGFIPGKIGFANFSQAHLTLYDNLTVTALRPEPAPEPASVLMLGMGMVALGLRRQRRRS